LNWTAATVSTLARFTVTYCTFQYEVAFRWFYSKKKAEVFCMRKIRGGTGAGTPA